jgi:phosphatidylinositol glycan class P protein
MKSIEIYSFVAWIASTIVFTTYILWAVLPEHVLHSYGISYYPDKNWAIAFPSVFVMAILCFYVAY